MGINERNVSPEIYSLEVVLSRAALDVVPQVPGDWRWAAGVDEQLVLNFIEGYNDVLKHGPYAGIPLCTYPQLCAAYIGFAMQLSGAPPSETEHSLVDDLSGDSRPASLVTLPKGKRSPKCIVGKSGSRSRSRSA